MLRITLGSIAGFIAWLIVWVVCEKVVSSMWPAFGTHQKAFEEALKNGGEFAPDTSALFTHIVLGSLVSLMAGALAAFIADANTRASLYTGCLLMAMGIAKAAMSWQYVPLWYHIIFTAILLPAAILGGRLIPTT